MKTVREKKPPTIPALQYAVRLLSSRGYSEKKLREKLLTRGYSKDEIGEVIAKLIGNRLLDDKKFAENFVRARSAVHPRGKTALIRDLISRGISPAMATSSVGEQVTEADEENLARDLVKRKSGQYASLEPDVRARRLYSLLARRGFRPTTIRKVIGNISEMDDE